jgi:hypothetical protein
VNRSATVFLLNHLPRNSHDPHTLSTFSETPSASLPLERMTP